MDPQIWSYLAQQKVTPEAQTTVPAEQATGPGKQEAPGGGFASYSTFIMIGAVFLFMYFFAIRPQRKEEKRKKEMLGQLGKGDTIVTTGGIVATVHSLKEDSVILRIGDNARMEVLKTAIGSVKAQARTGGAVAAGEKSDKNSKEQKGSKEKK